ncbi:MAG: hypothetical protein KBG15_10090 [Kofleriaceae bacterium]|nr:hypothetical protein [Kofleriaceae bacterium]
MAKVFCSKHALLIVALVLSACGNPAKPPATPALAATHKWAPNAFRFIPAETPYLFAAMDNGSNAVSRKLFADAVDGAKNKLILQLRGTDTPWARAMLALADEIAADRNNSWQAHLGLEEDLHYVLYGLSIWPVLRLNVTNPNRLRAVIQRTIDLAGLGVSSVKTAEATYWKYLEPNDNALIFVAVTDRELVATVMPSGVFAQALPYLLGSMLPDASLAQSSRIPTMMQRNGFTETHIGFVDFQHAAAIAFGRGTALETALRDVFNGTQIDAACRSDIDRLVALAPRMLWGMTQLNETGMAASMMLELDPVLHHSLAAMQTPSASFSIEGVANSIFAFGGALDAEKMIKTLGSLGAAVQARPFQCAQLAPVNEAIAKLQRGVDQQLPPQLRGINGFMFAIHEFATKPLNIEGFAMFEGVDTAAILQLVGGLLGNNPPRDGSAIAIPTASMGLPPQTTAHVALTPSRIAVGVGPQSETWVSKAAATPSDAHPPLVFFHYDFPRLKEMMIQVGSPLEQTESQIGVGTMVVNISDRGLRFDVSATW